MKAPNVSEQVEFSRRLSGGEIIQATKRIIGNAQCNPSEPAFYKEQRDKLGFAFSIGQTSGYQYQHLLVIPKRKSNWLYADYLSVREDYTSVEVISRFLPRRHLFSVPFSEAEAAQAVADFAAKLRQHPMMR